MSTAFGQTPPTSTARTLSVAPGSLAQVLNQLAAQTGMQILFDARLAQGRTSAGISGTMTADDALRTVLAGTGLRHRLSGANTIVLESGGAASIPPADVPGATPLDPVRVQAPATAPVQGYVAKRTTTATKTDTPLRDVPQSVTVIPREQIKDLGMQSMADVVRFVPGLTMSQGEGNRDQLTIRGQSTTADFFTDGIRDDVQYFRDLYNIDRVEALKGPNAMIFGRGGGGGVLNRVTKEPDGRRVYEGTLTAGSFGKKRASFDVGSQLDEVFAARLNAMYENSRSFRRHAGLERYGINPTVGFRIGDSTKVRIGYEYFRDKRTADRGIPSFQGKPYHANIGSFFGDPTHSRADAEVNTVGATVEHVTDGGLTIRNKSRFADYDKFYQNIFPGAINAGATQVALNAYNNATRRQNLFNQTDLIYDLDAGWSKHKLLAGFELGRQWTRSFRQTGYFTGNVTSITVPLDQVTVNVPVSFAQSASDANARTRTSVAAVYVQDQVEIGPYVQLIAGLRYDYFEVDFHNKRNGQRLSRSDDLFSPRLGVVVKPIEPLSLYASYSVSYLPSSGDQFGSLSSTTVNLKPEKFTNLEIGAKWDVLRNLAVTLAAFRLDRDNTSAPDPNNPGLVVQTGSQRSRGIELGIAGNITDQWQIAGGYAFQIAEIAKATSAAPAGRTVASVPRHTFSLWNKYQINEMWGVGLGIVHRSRMYAAIDNAVVLPSFTRFDAAVYFRINEHAALQLNVQNLFGVRYYDTANSNNNITPGAPRSAYLSLTAAF